MGTSKERCQAYFSPEVWGKLKNHCSENGISISEYLESLVRRDLFSLPETIDGSPVATKNVESLIVDAINDYHQQVSSEIDDRLERVWIKIRRMEDLLISFHNNSTVESPIELPAIELPIESPIESNDNNSTVESPIELPAIELPIESPIESNDNNSIVESPIESTDNNSTVESPIESEDNGNVFKPLTLEDTYQLLREKADFNRVQTNRRQIIPKSKVVVELLTYGYPHPENKKWTEREVSKIYKSLGLI